MSTRIVSLICVCGVMQSAFGLAGQSDARRERILMTKDISAYVGRDTLVTVREIELAPGARGSKHRHPGPVVVCVLEGTVEVALDGQSPTTYRRGACFSEDARQLHLYTRNPSATEPVRLLSYMVSRPGEALTQPEK